MRFTIKDPTERAARIVMASISKKPKPHERAREARLRVARRHLAEAKEYKERIRLALIEWNALTPFERSWRDRDSWVARRVESKIYTTEFGATDASFIL